MGMDISVLGVDLGKNLCSVVGLDASGAVVMRRKVRRETLIALAEKLPACIVGMEACCGAHHLGRAFAAHGHDVRLMSPECVRPYVKAQKTRRRGDRGSGEASDDAVCRTEEPGPARHANPASVEGSIGWRANGCDQSAARHRAGARNGCASGQTEARAVPEPCGFDPSSGRSSESFIGDGIDRSAGLEPGKKSKVVSGD